MARSKGFNHIHVQLSMSMILVWRGLGNIKTCFFADIVCGPILDLLRWPIELLCHSNTYYIIDAVTYDHNSLFRVCHEDKERFNS